MIALEQEVTLAESMRLKRIREQEGLVGIGEETKAEAAEAAKEIAERRTEANDRGMERFPTASEVLSAVAELIVSLPSFLFGNISSSLIRRAQKTSEPQVSLPLPDERFTSTRELLIRLYAFAQQNGFRLNYKGPSRRRKWPTIKTTYLRCSNYNKKDSAGRRCPYQIQIELAKDQRWKIRPVTTQHNHSTKLSPDSDNQSLTPLDAPPPSHPGDLTDLSELSDSDEENHGRKDNASLGQPLRPSLSNPDRQRIEIDLTLSDSDDEDLPALPWRRKVSDSNRPRSSPPLPSNCQQEVISEEEVRLSLALLQEGMIADTLTWEPQESLERPESHNSLKNPDEFAAPQSSRISNPGSDNEDKVVVASSRKSLPRSKSARKFRPSAMVLKVGSSLFLSSPDRN